MSDSLDSKHLRQIELCIEGHSLDLSALGRTISELESLYSLITNLDKEWMDRFWQQWATLEEIYAVALDSGVATLDKESVEMISEAIAELRKMVADKLS